MRTTRRTLLALASLPMLICRLLASPAPAAGQEGVCRALQRLFEAGVEEGRGEHDFSCVAELRADRLGSSPAE